MSHRQLTKTEITAFARKHAGDPFHTLVRRAPFTVDVRDGEVVCYPGSKMPFWPDLDAYIPVFNRTRSLRPSDYPAELWCNSYFVALADAVIKGTVPPPDPKSIATATKPTVPLPPSPAFDQAVDTLLHAKTVPLPAGNVKPPRVATTREEFARLPEVKAWVLRAADGRCDLCSQDAPFKTGSGVPFLELHHVIPLADGGADSISNAVALCPNCHRACHFAKNRADLTAQLYRRFARLKPARRLHPADFPTSRSSSSAAT